MMKSRKIRTLRDVVAWNLCTGCGACAYACKNEGVVLQNIDSIGIRPIFNGPCEECTECLSICPGYSVDGDILFAGRPKKTESDYEFGQTLEIWEGYASDPEIRRKGSSGGLLTALSLYCIERESMDFVLHSAMDPESPWLNKTFRTRGRADLLARTGSRYAPASPCDGLRWIEEAEKPCVFIGKPCDTDAATKLRSRYPNLNQKLGLVLSFFCAGTPSTQGTLDLLEHLNENSKDLGEIRYRGEGWPGSFKAFHKNSTLTKSLPYEDTWRHLTKYAPLRCRLCPDGLGRVSDISCGDAWHQYQGNNQEGISLVLVRTERGRDILQRAKDADYVRLVRADAEAVLSAQPNLLSKRKELFGRLLALRLLRVPTPQFQAFSLLRSWMRIPFGRKVRTVLGTLRRIVERDLWKMDRNLSQPAENGSLSGEQWTKQLS